MDQGGGTLRDPLRRNVTETQMSAWLSKVNKRARKYSTFKTPFESFLESNLFFCVFKVTGSGQIDKNDKKGEIKMQKW